MEHGAKKGTEYDSFREAQWPVIIGKVSALESDNFALETQLGHAHICMALAIHSKLTTVSFLICKMVITYLEMQAITFLSTREAVSRFSYIYK